jgi:LPS-assembly lipoprotein
MWWLRQRNATRRLARLAIVLAAASLTAGCFEPLYGSRPSIDSESVHDKLGAVEIAPIPARQGSPDARLAVALRNALQYDFNGNAGANAPTHRLEVIVSGTNMTVIIDPSSGRPTAQVGGVMANYKLTEIATGKVVVKDSTYMHADYDIPGPEQRFAKQRAQRNAEDRAVEGVAEAIRNRLASFFVAGT